MSPASAGAAGAAGATAASPACKEACMLFHIKDILAADEPAHLGRLTTTTAAYL